MKTVDEIILDIQELPFEDRQKVVDYLLLDEGEPFQPTRLSPGDMAKLDQDIEECRQGIDVAGPFTGEEAVAYLDQLESS